MPSSEEASAQTGASASMYVDDDSLSANVWFGKGVVLYLI